MTGHIGVLTALCVFILSAIADGLLGDSILQNKPLFFFDGLEDREELNSV